MTIITITLDPFDASELLGCLTPEERKGITTTPITEAGDQMTTVMFPPPWEHYLDERSDYKKFSTYTLGIGGQPLLRFSLNSPGSWLHSIRDVELLDP